MRAKHLLVWLGVGMLAAATWGAYEKPTREQIRAVVEDPAKIVELLKDASIDQAAELARDVIVAIIQLDLKPEERDRRITAVIAFLFRAFPPEQWKDLAISLGKFIAASPTASMSPEVLSAIQRGIIEAASIEIGNIFANSYLLAMQTIAGAPGGGKSIPPQPPPPPVALPYEGQRLR